MADLHSQQIRRARCRCARSPMLTSSSDRRSSPATTTIARSRSRASPSPGVSSGAALAAMAEVSAKTLPAGYSYEWTGTAYQEDAASGQTGAILGLAVLFAFLFLVGLYESWMIPVPVLLSVPVGVLGAFVGILLWRLVARPLCPDRSRRADRDGRQERHSDRRIRQGPARARARTFEKPRCSARGCGFAP